MDGEGENEQTEQPEEAPVVEITPEEFLEETPVPDTIPAPDMHPEPQPEHAPSPRRVAQE